MTSFREREFSPRLELRAEITQTEVLDNLENGREFVNKVIETIIKNPNSFTTVWTFGETGSGKETVNGQIILELKKNGEIQKFEKEIGKKLNYSYLSLGKSLQEAGTKKRKIVTSPWGEFNLEEFSRNSDFMAHTVAWSRDNLPRPTVLFVETVGIAFPADLGFTAFIRNVLASRREEGANHFAIFLVTDREVQNRAYRIRDPLWENPEENPDELFEREETVLDTRVSRWKREELQRSMGNKAARQRTTAALNSYLKSIRDELPARFSDQDLESSSRMEVLKIMLEQLTRKLEKTIGMSRGNLLVTSNIFLSEMEIHLFKGEVKKHMLNLKRVPYPYEKAPPLANLKEFIL